MTAVWQPREDFDPTKRKNTAHPGDIGNTPDGHVVFHDPEDPESASWMRSKFKGYTHAPSGAQYRLHDRGTMVTAHHQSKSGDYEKVGALQWHSGTPQGDGSPFDGGTVHKVVVDEEHRRRGVASAMMDFARERHPEQDIRHSKVLTNDGAVWAEKKATRRTAYGEIKAPAEVDTLRDEACPVCFTPETLIRTRGGLMPIASIQIGDEVLSKGGVYRRVTEVHENDYDGLLYEVKSRSLAEPIRVTPEHPFSVLVGKHVRDSLITDRCRPGRCGKYGTSAFVGRWGTSEITHGFGWAEARTLTKGQFLGTNFPQEDQLRTVTSVTVPQWARGTHARKGGTEFELTDDFLWMLGLYLAEGSASKRSINFALHQKEVEYVDHLESLFGRLGYTTSTRVREGHQGVWVEVYSSTLASWFPAWLGSGSHNKAFPAEILDLPSARLEKAVQGVLDGDATKARSDLTQTSPVLALQVAEFFARTGNAVSLFSHQAEGKKLAYSVNYEQKRSDKVTARSWRIDGTLVSEITDVRPVPYAGKVYNLSVAGHPSYTVQNVLVHNCGEQDAYDGAECAVCGFVAPPSQFQDPDVDMHKKLDLRGQDAEGNNPMADPNALDTDRDGLDDHTGLPVDAEGAADEGALDQQPLLGCDVCGEQFEAAHPQSVDTADPQNAEGLDGPAEGDLCPACGQGLLESGTELAQEGVDPEADPNAIPDEDPDPNANPDGDFDDDGIPDDQDPDPTDPTVPGGVEDPDGDDDEDKPKRPFPPRRASRRYSPGADPAPEVKMARSWERPGDRVVHMDPRELLPHVPADYHNHPATHQLADSMRQHGWDPEGGREYLQQAHDNWHEDENPVTLWHTDQGSFVEPGNHRAPAAAKAGLPHIPVLVKDQRTSRS